jgi:hypothetical protein
VTAFPDHSPLDNAAALTCVFPEPPGQHKAAEN